MKKHKLVLMHLLAGIIVFACQTSCNLKNHKIAGKTGTYVYQYIYADTVHSVTFDVSNYDSVIEKAKITKDSQVICPSCPLIGNYVENINFEQALNILRSNITISINNIQSNQFQIELIDKHTHGIILTAIYLKSTDGFYYSSQLYPLNNTTVKSYLGNQSVNNTIEFSRQVFLGCGRKC